MPSTVPIRMFTEARVSTAGKCRLTIQAMAGEVVVTTSAPPTVSANRVSTDTVSRSNAVLMPSPP